MDFSVISQYFFVFVLAAQHIILQASGKMHCVLHVVNSGLTIYFLFLPGNIEEHPSTVTVSEGEYASFKCSINCNDHVSLRWRLAAPRLGELRLNERYIKARALKRVWGRQGLTISSETDTSESRGCEVVTLKILATSELNGAVIQCAAIATRQGVSSSYSKFAFMQVEQAGSGGSGLRH